ncbi:hypothetical protein NP493_856g00005 [Ridgeia piscesae]|uniref:Fibrinogen C-terminal domain-containing protein n=1 Tax=Ridgeia piscesae TaxID=27915 RepID=A0AAD9KLW4_RIDPI|nr:hypothetical protein NP493_856g00005 [Ridgeia piscesae]
MVSQTMAEVPVSTPRNCADLYKLGVHTDGVYHVYPLRDDRPAAVFCDMTRDGGGWTVIQKRFNGEVDFYRGRSDYRDGFGSVFREYWWGNDKLYQLTTQEPQQLRIDLGDFTNQTRYAKYSSFGVADSTDRHRTSVGGYSGTAGDSFGESDGKTFTAYRDHDTYRTAQLRRGGWWSVDSNLNGPYRHGNISVYARGVCWGAWRGFYYSLKTTVMMVRPASFK